MAKQHPDNSFLRPKFLKWLLIGSAASFILVYVFSSSLFVRPLYRAEAVIFVPLTLFSQQFDQQGIGFASDDEIDGHIQMLQSTRLLDSLALNHDLATRYEIDRSEPGGSQRLHQKIRSRIDIGKTRYNSVSVRVSDPDPARAAAMANDIVRLGDVIKEDLLLENRLAAYAFSRDLYQQKLQEVELLEEQMAVMDTVTGNRPASGRFGAYRDQVTYESQVWELNERRNRYETLRKSLDVPLPQSYVVSAASEPFKPAWPPRLILAAAAAVIFAVLFFAIELVRKDVYQA